jgi:hypothetical protein
VINRLLIDPLRAMSNDPSRGLERLVRYALLLLRPLSFHYWLISLFPDPRSSGRSQRDLAVDISVVTQTALVIGLLFLAPASFLTFAQWLSGYLLFCLYLGLMNIVFFAAIPEIASPPSSVSRSVILIGMNLLQVTFSFALFYRAELDLEPTRAAFGSFLVLGTVGLPAEPNLIPWYLTPIQILCNLALVSVALGVFVGHLRLAPSEHQDNPRPRQAA